MKVIVSMPDELVRTVTEYAGAAMFDRYVAAAVEQRLRVELPDEEPGQADAKFDPSLDASRSRT